MEKIIIGLKIKIKKKRERKERGKKKRKLQEPNVESEVITTIKNVIEKRKRKLKSLI